MKKLLFAAIGVLMLAGCTGSNPINTIACDAQTAVVNLSSSAIASKLSCSNLAAIQASVLAVVQKANVCKPPATTAKGPIADALCPGIVSGVVAQVEGVVPAAWGCTGGTTQADLSALLTPICLKISF